MMSRTEMINFTGYTSNVLPAYVYLNKGSRSVIFMSSHDPRNAAITAGMPNRIKTFLSACLPTRNNLKILLKKCTTPVRAIARSTGKKIINTGVRIVPSPKPEKNVRIAVIKATSDMIKISI